MGVETTRKAAILYSGAGFFRSCPQSHPSGRHIGLEEGQAGVCMEHGCWTGGRKSESQWWPLDSQ